MITETDAQISPVNVQYQMTEPWRLSQLQEIMPSDIENIFQRKSRY